MDASVAGETLEFEGWRFCTRSGDLLREDPRGPWAPVSIGARARDVLAILLQQPGALVSKDAIIDAVWPNVTVEPNNLTVQIATLRRILDDGRAGNSCIETVPGRGYRFVLRLTRLSQAQPNPLQAPTAEPKAWVITKWQPLRRLRLWLLVGPCAVAIAALLATSAWHCSWFVSPSSPPRLSLVVIPFQNLGDDPKDDHMADGITDDLTSDLSHLPGALVAAHTSAGTFKGNAVDVRQIGEALDVRYVLEGSVRRVDDTLRINVQLISTETGTHVWSDRFDQQTAHLGAGLEQAVMRIRDELGISLVDIESARSLRERPTNPDAFDLILQARSIRTLPPNPQRNNQALALFERALTLDPTSVYAMTYVAYSLADAASEQGWGRFEDMDRAGRLLKKARTLAPASDFVLNTYVLWLRTVGRCPEAIELAKQALETDPKRMRVWTGLYNELAMCKVWSGDAEQALTLQGEADRLNPFSPWKFVRYHQMGKALLLLGREPDAIDFLERAIAMNPNDQWGHRWLAVAYALVGRIYEARHSLAEADKLWPYVTVRGFDMGARSNAYVVQTGRFREALRLAGKRDHADEDADFRVPPDRALHSEVAGHTPMSAPGASTIRTRELAWMIAESHPVIIDAATALSGQSVPGAIGLKFAGLGGSYTDEAQDRLRSKMHELTAGDLDRPIVAIGWNSERFDGRNLALRLVALGYTNVCWYRGGREAWEVAGLPGTELDVQDW